MAMQTLDLGIDNNEEIKHLFRQFDTTNNGQIDLQEFLRQLKPPLNERRRKAALNLFNSMDVNKDGKLTIVDLKVSFLLTIANGTTPPVDLFLDEICSSAGLEKKPIAECKYRSCNSSRIETNLPLNFFVSFRRW